VSAAPRVIGSTLLGSTDLEENPHNREVLRAHGGAIPLFVSGGLVGTITMSGEPDVVDHAAAAETVRRFLARVATPG
jgi:uncharacterized protein (UPF0303 family)